MGDGTPLVVLVSNMLNMFSENSREDAEKTAAGGLVSLYRSGHHGAIVCVPLPFRPGAFCRIDARDHEEIVSAVEVARLIGAKFRPDRWTHPL